MNGLRSLRKHLNPNNYCGDREPLIVNPRGHISSDDVDDIISQFEKTRGSNMDGGPAMYLIAPYDRQTLDQDENDTSKNDSTSKRNVWTPSVASPEWVVLKRAVALADRSSKFLQACLKSFEDADWSPVFQETMSSFQSYSVLLRVDGDFVIDTCCSSTSADLGVSSNKEGTLESAYTRSMRARFLGPKALRRKMYRNLLESGDDQLLLGWRPLESLIEALRVRFQSLAIFFYNELSPEVVAVLWRPKIFEPIPFSVMTSEYIMPLEPGDWKSDSLVMRNADDILREMSQYYQNIVTTIKIMDESPWLTSRKRRKTDDESEVEMSNDDSNKE